MKSKTKKRINGSISVLLVIIMLPMMTFSAVIVDLSRINMARQMMSSAGDLTMNTALANYDTILKDVYGLFAMSQAQGMDNEQLGTELNNYFARTLTSYGIVSEEDADDYVSALIGDFRELLNEGTISTNDFLKLSNIDFNADMVEQSSLENASVMRKQIVEYMKYRAPLGLGLSFLDSLTSFEKMDAQNKVVEAQVKAQESTQDVTKACQKLITLIREYDKRVVEIDSALKGVKGSTDTTIIPLEDYDTHVMKYLADWDENYTHVNKLNLVFLANTPSVDDVYLKSLAYANGEHYIKADGTLYSGSSSTGINVNPDLAGDTQSAKAQIDQQINSLNNTYKPYANNYSNSMLPSTLLTLHSNNINSVTISKEKEDDAIDSFIKFEKFLLDKSDGDGVKYTQIRSVLEQIAILDKYRDNYEKYINADIESAEADKQSAQNELDSLITTRDEAATAMNNRVSYINNTINSYLSGYENVDDAVDFLGASNRQSEIKSALEQLPGISGGYSQYYNSNIKSGTSDIYLTYFKWLVNSSSFASSGTAAQKKIVSEAKNYVNANGWDANGFDSYMKGKLSVAEEGDDLFKLLSCLKTCHAYAITYNNNISTYSDAADQIPAAQSAVNEAEQQIIYLNNTKTATINSVKSCIQQFNRFGNAYQADAYYYNYYIVAAKNTIGPEAQKINAHFTQLLVYLKELRDDLNAIDVQIGVVKNAIKTYGDNLDNWNSANNTYESSKGGDSFSSQTSADIEKARNEYDPALYETLDTFTIAMWNEFDELYSKLTDPNNFKYGSKRIDQIASADDLKNAISGVSFSDIVTVDEATQKLSSLYKAETIDYVPYTMDYTTPKQLGFLSPTILQIQALKYLNGAYPDGTKLSDKQQTANKNTEDQYNAAKDKLTGKTKDSGNSDSNASEDTPSADFGYTYNKNKITSGNLPSDSTSTDKKEFSDSEYTLTESGEEGNEKLNASNSVGEQSKKSNSVLSGIANIATTAVENLYILNYVFENFSYNTIVQEQVIEDNPLNSGSVWGQREEVKKLLSDGDKLSNSKNNVTTLSNYHINEHNNYLYGGEVEYILFGSSDPGKNVTSAKASIYAIRFGFNCIFAFTDSEIRNTTMAAGLAVQAATLGFVPYQIVQIVLQLALAAAESAIDLSSMNLGLSVAIIKTKDTWSLSMSGAKNALQDAANAAINIATDAVMSEVDDAIKNVTNGLNNIVDAGADELKGAIEDLEKNMTSAAEGVLESVVDDVFTAVMSEIEEGLNSLQTLKVGNTTAGAMIDELPKKEDVREEAVTLFQNIRNKVDTIITGACGGNEMALALTEELRINVNEVIETMETKVLNTVDSAGDADITSYISQEMNSLKMELIKAGNSAIANLGQTIQDKADAVVDQSKDKIQDYINQCGENLSEEAAKRIKEEVSSFADSFVENTLKVNGTSSDVSSGKGSVVSMFKFGYKDYLMLLTYISICCGDSVLVRTADVIQMNIQHAGANAEYQHKSGADFLMSKAYTYVSISATADLDMFFMDFGIFADQVAEDTPEGEEPANNSGNTEEKSGTKISYKGLLGY